MKSRFYLVYLFISLTIYSETLEEEFTRIYKTKAWGVNEKGEGFLEEDHY